MFAEMRGLLEFLVALLTCVASLILVDVGNMTDETIAETKALTAAWFGTDFVLLLEMNGADVLVEVTPFDEGLLARFADDDLWV